MKKRKKIRENGFTLVELIVVVLIMTIIAVALAPQVMKWVDESRKSADSANYDALYESVQLSMTNPAVYNKMSSSSEDLVVEMSPAGTSVKAGPFVSGDEFHAVMSELNPDWEDVAVKSEEGNTYTITVKAGVCSLFRSNPPVLDEENVGGVSGVVKDPPVVSGEEKVELDHCTCKTNCKLQSDQTKWCTCPNSHSGHVECTFCASHPKPTNKCICESDCLLKSNSKKWCTCDGDSGHADCAFCVSHPKPIDECICDTDCLLKSYKTKWCTCNGDSGHSGCAFCANHPKPTDRCICDTDCLLKSDKTKWCTCDDESEHSECAFCASHPRPTDKCTCVDNCRCKNKVNGSGKKPCDCKERNHAYGLCPFCKK